MRVLFAAAIVAGTPAVAFAGGFYIPEIGTRAPGVGAAVAAEGAEASATFHNPATLDDDDDGDTTDVEASTALFFPEVTFFRRPVEDPSTGDMVRFGRVDDTSAVIPAPYLGARHRLGEKATVGLAIFAPFAATLEFPDDGAQRHVITAVHLRTIFFGPSASYRLPGGWSVGASVHGIYADLALEQRNAIPFVTGDPEQYPDPDPALEGNTHLEGKDPFTVAATFGVAWRSPDARLKLGASLLTPATLHLEGDARVENEAIDALRDEDGNELQPRGVREDQIRVELPLPLIARAGVSYRPAPRWRAELDVNFQRWSTFEKLTIDFVNEYVLLPTPGAYLYDVNVESQWRDTWSARLGGEYDALPGRLAVRGGIVFDQSPVDDRHFALLTPDSDKLGVAAGARWSQRLGDGRLDLDLSAVHLFLRERDVGPSDGMAGTDGTILNKPAPSFFHGVTRAGFDVVTLAVAWRQ
jgi:long-chain fatty acid transport protein